jgi:HPt (histidine-containing phosphotransfer) domain-containing protein
VFDEQSLLGRVGDDAELARTIMHAFLDDLPKQLDALTKLVTIGDTKGAERQAHTIKGAAAAVSGSQLVQLALVLEHNAKAGDLTSVGAELGELRERFARLRSAMLASASLSHGKR